jgi:hypothetical protein
MNFQASKGKGKGTLTSRALRPCIYKIKVALIYLFIYLFIAETYVGVTNISSFFNNSRALVGLT